MTSFSTNWVKDNRPSMSERIKQSAGPQQPLKPRIEFAKNKIQAQNQKLDAILEKLKGKEKSLFNQVVSALQRHDAQAVKMISQLKMALEQIQMRLETTIDLGDVMVAIGPAMGALTRVRSGLAGVMPEVDRELGEINGVFSDIMMSAGSMGNTSFAFDASGEEVDRILAEAGAVAEQRMSENFPDVPVGSTNVRTSAGEHSQ